MSSDVAGIKRENGAFVIESNTVEVSDEAQKIILEQSAIIKQRNEEIIRLDVQAARWKNKLCHSLDREKRLAVIIEELSLALRHAQEVQERP